MDGDASAVRRCAGAGALFCALGHGPKAQKISPTLCRPEVKLGTGVRTISTRTERRVSRELLSIGSARTAHALRLRRSVGWLGQARPAREPRR